VIRGHGAERIAHDARSDRAAEFDRVFDGVQSVVFVQDVAESPALEEVCEFRFDRVAQLVG